MDRPVLITLAALAVAFVLAVVVRRAEPALARGAMGARNAKYVATAVRGSVLSGLVLVLFWAMEMRSGRGDLAAALGEIGVHARLPVTDLMVVASGMLALATIASFVVTILRAAAGGAATALGLDMLPQTTAETFVWSLLVSPVAGVGEEFVFRGFVMGQLWGLTGDGWIAAALSSVLFGLMHLYQGSWGVVRTALIGFVFALGVLLTGSLVPSMLAHTLANILGAVFPPRRAVSSAAAPAS